MAFETFEQPIYVQRKHFIQEITGLDDLFDFLDEWPQDGRDLVYEVMVDACRKAASGQLPVPAVADNFRRFLKRHGKLANVKDVPLHLRQPNEQNASGI
jgi:circadian clock protein KaiC